MTSAKLASIAQINPPGPRRGEVLPDELLDFVPMAALGEDGHMRTVEKRRYSEVSTGFTPFQNGDVLVAKITPCFENNKIGIAEIESVFGFGSTEFHVIRCDPNVLLNRYLLYILRHPHIRVVGEIRMTGSGGQRRVPSYFLEELEVPLPSVDEQHRCAEILSNVDRMRVLHSDAAAKATELLEILGDRAFRGGL